MKSIIDYVEHWAATRPEKLMNSFLNLDGKEINAYTYLEFSNHTRNLAEHLSREVGQRHGHTVLLVYPPGLEIVVDPCVRTHRSDSSTCFPASID